jgi:hypothetical protein
MMDLLKPPTDNLYKFIAVSGVVLIVAGLAYPPVFFHQTGMEYLTQVRSSKELEVHEKFIKERLETLNLRQQQAIDEKTKLQKRLNELNSAARSTEVDKLEGRIKEANREIESIADASHELKLNLALKQAQTESEETVSLNNRRDSRLIILVGWGAALFGLFFAGLGFRLWHKRLQKFQDQLVEKEATAKLATNTADEQSEPVRPD